MEIMPLEPQSDASIVETLESALAEAREGRLSSVAVAMVYRDGRTGQLWSTAPLSAMLIGAIARLMHRYNESGMS
jgi:hypothetical protein